MSRVHNALRRLERTGGHPLFDVGLDSGTPIDDNDYQVPFAFTGTLEKVTVELGDLKATLAEIIDFKIDSLNY